MFNVRTALLVLSLLMLSAPALAQGFKFTSTLGKFTVHFPGAAKPEELTDTKTGTGPAYPFSSYLLRQVEGRMIALAGWVDYNPAFNFGTQAEIDANRDNFLKGVGGTLVSEKAITLGQYPGKEFIGDIKGQRAVRGRIFIVGKRPYFLVSVVPTGTYEAETLAFLNSFKLTK